MIPQIKEQVSMVEAVDKYVSLSPSDSRMLHSGRRKISIRCPFHDDRSPSFAVHAEDNTFACYAGCGYGDVLDFVGLALKLDRKRSMYKLMQDFNVQRTEVKKKPIRTVLEQLAEPKDFEKLLSDAKDVCQELLIFYKHDLDYLESYLTEHPEIWDDAEHFIIQSLTKYERNRQVLLLIQDKLFSEDKQTAIRGILHFEQDCKDKHYLIGALRMKYRHLAIRRHWIDDLADEMKRK